MTLRVVSAAAIVAVLATSACGGHASRLTITAQPLSAPFDTPFTVEVRGLGDRAPARISFVGRPRSGHVVRWDVDVRADSRGDVALGHAYPYAHLDPKAGWPTRFTISVSSGHRTASTRAARSFALQSKLVTEDARPSTVGFYGEWIRLPSARHHTAILVFGGSEGGLSPGIQGLARVLATHGYPVLALAYFREPGIAPGLYDVPLEYFARALRWIAKQPAADPNRIVTLGVSRGQEASLLVASAFPRLVHAAVGYVGYATIRPALAGADAPAWTYRGKPATGDPETVRTGADFGWIPVERINGPVFVVGGGADGLVPSALSARQIAQRMAEHHRHDVTALAYPKAGHELGGVLPRLIVPRGGGYGVMDSPFQGRQYLGGSPRADEAALEDSWPKLLAFLGRVGTASR
jgi:dienelactone hydrolase